MRSRRRLQDDSGLAARKTLGSLRSSSKLVLYAVARLFCGLATPLEHRCIPPLNVWQPLTTPTRRSESNPATGPEGLPQPMRRASAPATLSRHSKPPPPPPAAAWALRRASKAAARQTADLAEALVVREVLSECIDDVAQAHHENEVNELRICG